MALQWSIAIYQINWNICSDMDYDDFTGSFDTEELYMKMKSFFKCPECGRIWVFWKGFDSIPVEYVPVKSGNSDK